MSSDPPVRPTAEAEPEPAGGAERAVADPVAVVGGDVSVVVGGAEPRLLELSERLRKIEEELAGVFETVGRLLGRIEALESGRTAGEDRP